MAKRIAVDRKTVLEAIRRATRKLGRPPKRGELPQVAGISHSALLTHFRSIREALRAAGLKPVQKGMKIPGEVLLADWIRVRDKLGRAPGRQEYIRHGRYAVTTLAGRFGGWTQVPLQVQRLEGARADAAPVEAVETANQGEIPVPAPALLRSGEANEGDKAIVMQWAGAMTALPGNLAGKRRVTDAVCAMIVNTLMGEDVGRRCRPIIMGEAAAEHVRIMNGDAAHHRNGNGQASVARGAGMARLNGMITSGGVLDGERSIMGPPFDRSVLTNAPMNEFGVVFLFGMLAGELGFQVESLRGDFPDCEARRQIQPGKWQRVRIEFEYESRNFAHHGHDPDECDVIVCWKHNWVKCPASIEVIALSRILRCAQ